MKRKLDKTEFESFVVRFLMSPIVKAWCGDYLALYLDFGLPVGVFPLTRNPRYERHIFVGYDWSYIDSEANLIRRQKFTEPWILKALAGELIESITLNHANELIIRFDSGCNLRTVGNDGPDWNLFEAPDQYIFVEDCFIKLELSGPA